MMVNSPFFEEPTIDDLCLNNLGSLLLFLLMLWDAFKNVLSKFGFWGFFIFSVLHSIGATWLYSSVPYNKWFIDLIAFDFNSFFDFSRNHYDRLVHFSFGLLLLAATKDILIHNSSFNLKQSLLVAFLCIQAFSMVYELFEWSLAITLSEEAAENYNGQQGDAWDAHKDMALAMIGSLLSWVFISQRGKKLLQVS